MRRVLDILISLTVLLLISPLLLVAAIAVKLSSPGPVFYRAERVGRGMKPFHMFKFRSMFTGADLEGPGISVRDDPRVTRTGQFLRTTKIDEFPQFINVLMGEMTLIGPRPEAPKFVLQYTPEQKTLLSVRPGITGPGQIEYTLGHQNELPELDSAEDLYVRQMLSEKLRWDLEYLRSRSFFGDVKIVARTAWIVVQRIVEPSARGGSVGRTPNAGSGGLKP